MSETATALLAAATARLKAAGVPSPRAEARLLLRTVLDTPAEALFGAPETLVAEEQCIRFRDLVRRRAGRTPMAQILGSREFWSLRFEVTADTLDPRPDSEAVVEVALDWVRNRNAEGAPLRVLDLGTGTGCLLCAVLSEIPQADGVGTDISPAAVAVAARNAAGLGLSARAAFFCADWDSGLDGVFDLIVGNPPYIPGAAIASLEPEVAIHEPRGALDGGPDGLDAYRGLAPRIARRLAPGGAAFLEIGAGREEAVEDIMAARGLNRFVRKRDLGGIIRCLGFARAGLVNRSLGK